MNDSITVPKLPPRPADAHKGMFGRLLVVAGSRGMSGAAVLCATAGLRGGAGLVQVAVPADILPIVAGGNPCYMTAPLEQDSRGRIAAAAVDEVIALATSWADVVALGPGLGQSEAMPALVSGMLQHVEKPLVIDADGLNALARLPARPGTITGRTSSSPRTPGSSPDWPTARRTRSAPGGRSWRSPTRPNSP